MRGSIAVAGLIAGVLWAGPAAAQIQTDMQRLYTAADSALKTINSSQDLAKKPEAADTIVPVVNQNALATDAAAPFRLPAPAVLTKTDEILSVVCKGDDLDKAQCAKLSSLIARNAYDYLEEVAGVAKTLAPGMPGTLDILNSLSLARETANQVTALAAARGAQYGIYIGPNYSLGGEGKWKSGVETLLRFDSPIHNNGLRLFGEASYQTINALDEPVEAVTDPATPDSGTGGSTTKAEANGLNPFLESGGYFRANGGLQWIYDDTYGVQGGYGFSSRPNDVAEAHLYHRWFAGLHAQRVYSGGVTARFFAGYAHDEFWQRQVPDDAAMPDGPSHLEENFNRLNVEIFGATPLVSKLHAALRLFLDVPANDRGPSDVRVSALLYYDLPSWLGNFKLDPKAE